MTLYPLGEAVLRTHLKKHTGEKSNKCNQGNYVMLLGVMIWQGMKVKQVILLLTLKLKTCHKCFFCESAMGGSRS